MFGRFARMLWPQPRPDCCQASSIPQMIERVELGSSHVFLHVGRALATSRGEVCRLHEQQNDCALCSALVAEQ
eukprot:4451033-Alexandrium_andersonii.AAC.1